MSGVSMPITNLARPVLPNRQCVACGRSPVRLTLMTDYGRYLVCDSCGRAWHEERGKGEPAELAIG